MLGALKTEGGRSFWQGVLVNSVFFCFGVGATLIIGSRATFPPHERVRSLWVRRTAGAEG